MAPIGRPGLSDEQKEELWRRWGRGQSLSDIGRALDKHPASIFGVLRLFGGYRPASRSRSARSLSFMEREEISRGLSADKSMRQIARDLGGSPSTISREISRNGGANRYRAGRADEYAWDSARRPKWCRRATNSRLCRRVSSMLAHEWSPEQIAGWLKTTYPDDGCLHVSHETIYKSLFIQSRGVLNQGLQKH